MTRLEEKLIPMCPEPDRNGLIWKDVSDEIQLKDGKGNPFGWSQYRMEWNGETIGWLESGHPNVTGDNWQVSSVVDPMDKLKHVFFFKGMCQEDWDAVKFMKQHEKICSTRNL